MCGRRQIRWWRLALARTTRLARSAWWRGWRAYGPSCRGLLDRGQPDSERPAYLRAVCRARDSRRQPQSCRQALGKRVADGVAEQGAVTALCDVDQATLDDGDRDVIPYAPLV